MPFEWKNTWVVTVAELVPDFYNKEATLRQDVSRYRTKDYGIKQVQLGGNGRQALYDFYSLPQEMQNALGGDPKKITNPLELYYKTDKAAVEFFGNYRFDDDTPLKLQHQDEYITNASVLRAAIELKAARENERRSKGGSCKRIMATICSDVALFNKVLRLKHNAQHTLPASEKRFKETFRLFSNGFNYGCLISGKLKNENRRLVTDDVLYLLNDLFATQSYKPTRTEITKQYDAFLSGYVEVINPETGELYDPKDFKPLSYSTILNYLNKWQDKIANTKLRTGNRQSLIREFRPYHSMEKPAYAGSIISVDDRQPPFKYDSKHRPWFYNAIDLGSEAWVCWVHGKSKAGIIEDFYRQLLRNYHAWGLNLPAELECEMALNSSFTNTFLKEGRMFETVRMEANNARGKRIERFFKELRYGNEKQREGWLARPTALNEANQAGRRNSFTPSEEEHLSKAPIVPYDQIVDACMNDLMEWNNSPHSVHTDKTRWEVFLEMQHPNLSPINWNVLLPYIGYKTQTSCQLNGIIHLNNEEFLLGRDGEVATGEPLINMMKNVAGRAIDVYWLDDNDGNVIRAMIFLRNTDQPICEAVPKPVYQRATKEQTDEDKKKAAIMSAYVATIEGYMNRKAAERTHLVVIDNRNPTLNNKFVIPRLKQRETIVEPTEAEVLGQDDDDEQEKVPVYNGLRSFKDRF